MKSFFKIYFIGIALVFMLASADDLISKIKAYRRTKRWNSRRFDWKRNIYYSLYSFGFFAILLYDYLEDKF